MNMGESVVAREAYTADHTGMSFMLSIVPTVKSVFPSMAGTLGGARVTIMGNGFSNKASAVNVEIAGTPCRVLSATIEQIVCQVAEHAPTTASGRMRDQHIGERGIRMRLWYRQGRAPLEDVRAGRLPPPNVSQDVAGFYEAPEDVMYATSTDVGPAGMFEGYFRAPVASNYTFLTASDDWAELWLGRNASSLSRRIQFTSWSQHRDWTLNWEYSGGRYDTYNSIRLHLARTSAPVWLNKGDFIYTRALYTSAVGGDHFSLAVKMHASDVGRKHTPHGVDEKQVRTDICVRVCAFMCHICPHAYIYTHTQKYILVCTVALLLCCHPIETIRFKTRVMQATNHCRTKRYCNTACNYKIKAGSSFVFDSHAADIHQHFVTCPGSAHVVTRTLGSGCLAEGDIHDVHRWQSVPAYPRKRECSRSGGFAEGAAERLFRCDR
jgi:hypothetical protein